MMNQRIVTTFLIAFQAFFSASFRLCTTCGFKSWFTPFDERTAKVFMSWNGGGRPRYGGAGGRSSGSRGRFVPQDPAAKLRFSKTIKIDTSITAKLADMALSDGTRKVLEKKGFNEMTPVQSQSYDLVFSGADVVARSRTGTGKTFAFGLPLIEKIVSLGLNDKRGAGLPLILVLEPTRELALQVAQELGSVCAAHRMRVLAMFGGSSFGLQEKAIRAGVHILVSTPGRILDHISRGTVDLSGVMHVVLDEGDTMLEMGFQKDVENILANVKVPGEASRNAATASLQDYGDDDFADDTDDYLSTSVEGGREVQTLLFSATMPGWICQVTDKHMKNPIFLDAVQEGETRLATTIKHLAIRLPPGNDRLERVEDLLENLILTKGMGGQTIVFTNKKEDADILSGSSCFGQLKTQVLHGDISQATRQTTLKQFKEGNLDVLIATDVAARGLDIAGVDLVVHACPPLDHDTYVHRSGRTGRAGRNGTSVVLFSGSSDESALFKFESLLQFKFERVGPPSAHDIAEASATLASKKLTKVSDDVVSYFKPYSRSLIEKFASGGGDDEDDLFLVDGDSDEENEEEEGDAAGPRGSLAPFATTILDENGESKVVYSAEVVESLFARCLAAISSRNTIKSTSMLTGEPDMMTFLVDATFKNGTSPTTVRDWQKLIAGVLRRSLGIEDVILGKVLMGKGGESGGFCSVADFPDKLGKRVLKELETTTLPQGIKLRMCEKLPPLVQESSYGGGGGWDRRGGGDSRGGGGDYRGGGGGGYRGGGGGAGGYRSGGGPSSFGGGYRGSSGGSSGGSGGSWSRPQGGAGGPGSWGGASRPTEGRPRVYETRRS